MKFAVQVSCLELYKDILDIANRYGYVQCCGHTLPNVDMLIFNTDNKRFCCFHNYRNPTILEIDSSKNFDRIEAMFKLYKSKIWEIGNTQASIEGNNLKLLFIYGRLDDKIQIYIPFNIVREIYLEMCK